MGNTLVSEVTAQVNRGSTRLEESRFQVSVTAPDASRTTVPHGSFPDALQLLISETPSHGEDPVRVFAPDVGFIRLDTRFSFDSTHDGAELPVAGRAHARGGQSHLRGGRVMRWSPSALLLPCALVLGACAGAPKVVKPATPAAVTADSLEFSDADLKGFKATLALRVESPGTPATVRSVKSELVVEGEVVATREEPATLTVEPGAAAALSVSYEARYAPRPEDAPPGGTQLVAVRGTVTLDRGGFEETVPFARSREIRLPRQPTVSLRSVEGARYAADRAVFTAYLAVTNPNPFPARIEEVRYKATFGGKDMSEGRVGRAALLAEASTDTYEVPVTLDAETYGPEVVALIRGLVIPYRIEGQLVGEGLDVPFTLQGEVRLNPQR